jgi:hypothetical protein
MKYTFSDIPELSLALGEKRWEVILLLCVPTFSCLQGWKVFCNTFKDQGKGKAFFLSQGTVRAGSWSWGQIARGSRSCIGFHGRIRLG